MPQFVPPSYMTADGQPRLATRLIGEAIVWVALAVCSPLVLRERLRRRRERRSAQGRAIQRTIETLVADLADTVRQTSLRGADGLRLKLVAD